MICNLWRIPSVKWSLEVVWYDSVCNIMNNYLGDWGTAPAPPPLDFRAICRLVRPSNLLSFALFFAPPIPMLPIPFTSAPVNSLRGPGMCSAWIVLRRLKKRKKAILQYCMSNCNCTEKNSDNKLCFKFAPNYPRLALLISNTEGTQRKPEIKIECPVRLYYRRDVMYIWPAGVGTSNGMQWWLHVTRNEVSKSLK